MVEVTIQEVADWTLAVEWKESGDVRDVVPAEVGTLLINDLFPSRTNILWQVYTGSPRLSTVLFVGIYTVSQAYNFSTSFYKGAKRVGSNDVATGKALIGSQIFSWRLRAVDRKNLAITTLPGLSEKTVEPFLLWTNSEVQTFLTLVTDDRTLWVFDEYF